MHVFWDVDFGWILGGFWEGFGRPKSWIFDVFSNFFRCKNLSATWKGQKSKKQGNKSDHPLIIPSVWRSVRPWGEGKRMGGRQLGMHLGMNPWPAILAMLLEMQFWNLDLVSGTLGIPSGGGGCAVHNPPHRKGRRQNAGKCKSVVTAFIKSIEL